MADFGRVAAALLNRIADFGIILFLFAIGCNGSLNGGRLEQHRVMWIREMSEADIKSVGETGPTIDSIQVAEFESQAAQKEWLAEHAPAFLR